MNNLPDEYDLIVVGTGMPECIVAAAAARIGKSVLHIDRNHYYGGLWASFNLEGLIQWADKQIEPIQDSSPRILETQWSELLNDNEHLVLCAQDTVLVSDIAHISYLSKSRSSEIANEINVKDQENVEDDAANLSACAQPENSKEAEPENRKEAETENSKEAEPENSKEEAQLENSNEARSEECEKEIDSGDKKDSSDEKDLGEDTNDEISVVKDSEQTDKRDSNAEVTKECRTRNPLKTYSTMEELLQHRQKFNIDLSPKILFSRGSLVELLISSNISRYAEFQGMNRILTYIDGHLEQVPCSRADVFSTKNVNVVEKRMLMKLLTFCLDYQNHAEEYKDFEERPFVEFLRSRKTTANIEHYIIHAIAMVDKSCSTLQGLEAVQKFMKSLGRFGNSPFLWSCYGSAELPQCFCRLCAVFGGIYYLGRAAEAIIFDSDNHCAGIISDGKKFKCTSLVMEYSYVPQQYLPELKPELVSRAIFITDSSIMAAERQQNTLLRLPPVTGVSSSITVLEFGSMSHICPQNLYIVHMTCRSFCTTAREDFEAAEKELFKASGEECSATEESDKPNVLWSLYFKQYDTTNINIDMPDGVYVTSSPGLDLDFEHAVSQARNIFEKLYPEEEFLPRAPDPEDIVMEENLNPENQEQSVSSDNNPKEAEVDVNNDSGDHQELKDSVHEAKPVESAVDAFESNENEI